MGTLPRAGARRRRGRRPHDVLPLVPRRLGVELPSRSGVSPEQRRGATALSGRHARSGRVQPRQHRADHVAAHRPARRPQRARSASKRAPSSTKTSTAVRLLAHLREHGDVLRRGRFSCRTSTGRRLPGVPLVAERAFLIPCVHDEAYAYLEPVRAASPRSAACCSTAPAKRKRRPRSTGRGAGEEPRDRPRRRAGAAAGRRRWRLARSRRTARATSSTSGARIPRRTSTFSSRRFARFASAAWRRRCNSYWPGPRAAAHSGDGILDLGAGQRGGAKAQLLTYARALAQPSIHESFSRAMYESWYARRPVLVHGECRATARAVEDAGGGWIGRHARGLGAHVCRGRRIGR